MEQSTAPRRAFTVPARLQDQRPATSHNNASASSSAEEDSMTLYAHPQTKTVSFSSKSVVPASATSAWGTSKIAGTIPWSHPSERVVATGLLRIYRLKSSGAACFLHTGDALISLLARSQCWCVDGVSRFAMRIQLCIYRFELPSETDDEKASLEEFKSVLSKILYYERTPCPFKRGFEQDHTEELPSPASKKRRGPSKKARRWGYDARWRPEDDPDYVPGRPVSGDSPGDSDSNMSDATEGSISEAAYEPPPPLRVDKPSRPSVASAISMFSKSPITDTPRGQATLRSPEQSKETIDGVARKLEVSSISADVAQSTTSQVAIDENEPQASTGADMPEAVEPVPRLRNRSITGTGAALTDGVTSQPIRDFPHARDDSIATVTPASFGRPTTPPTSSLPAAATSPSQSRVTLRTDPLTPPASASDGSESFSLCPVSHNDSRTTISSSPQITPPKSTASGLALLAESPPGTASPMARSLSIPPIAAIPEDSEVPQEPIPVAPTTPAQSKRDAVRRRRTASPRSHQRFRSQDVPSYIRDDISAASPRASSSSALVLSPANIVGKTLALMLGPPSGLVQIMVQIAARIRHAGASGAAVFSVKSMMKVMRARGRALPGRWLSDSEDEDEVDDEDDGADEGVVEGDEQWAEGPNEDDDEDDFGVPLGVQTPARNRRMEWGGGGVGGGGSISEA